MTVRILLLVSLFSSMAAGQIAPGGIVNVASFAPQGLPNAKIARGSMFTVFGQSLAEPGLAQVSEFPLPTTLGGALLEVEVAGVVRACYPIFTTPGQLGVLLPSDTPAGTGELRVSFGGQTYTEPIDVVDRSFGIFAQNQQGNGLAVFQNFVSETEQPVNGPLAPIAAGGVGTLWGVGLGPVTGDEAERVLPGDLGRDLEVYVGGVRVTNILYAGRSGCCSGIDQIVFEIPAGLAGCYLPVVVVLDGIPSNQALISVGAGAACGDADAFSEAETSAIGADADFRFGRIDFSRIDWLLAGTPVLEEQASGVFRAFDGSQFLRNPSYFVTGDNDCVVRMISENPNTQGVIAPFTSLDAGASIAYQTPSGERTMDDLGDVYVDDAADLVPFGSPVYSAGVFSFSGPGGADVGAFEAADTVGTRLMWSNRDAIAAVDLGQGLTVRWMGGDPAERVVVFGVSLTQNRTGKEIGASFACDAAVAAGELTVPDHVLAALPPSGTRTVPGVGTFPSGTLQVGTDTTPVRFDAEGLDIGFVTHVFSEGLLGLEYR